LEKSKIKVLLIEDNPGGALFWEQIIAEVKDIEITFIHIEQLSDFSHRVESEAPDIILLDLSLPEEDGMELFLSVYKMAPALPIIVVSETDDQKLAVQTALAGAQDFLVKKDIGSFLLSRSIRYAIGRQSHLKEEKAVSGIDELTGLYNRRGFLARAEQQIKIADELGRSLLMVFTDVDGLKEINDTLGHHWGDLAIMEMAHVLREAFRETDILGRLSGDEFVALLTCENNINEEFLTKRFRETMDEHNTYQERHFKLSASMGIAHYESRYPCSVGELMASADTIMYQQKKPKKGVSDLKPRGEKRESPCSILTQFLADSRDESIVRLMLPLLRACIFDKDLSFQLSAWMTKGSHGLKLSLIHLIEEMTDARGGPILETALLDETEEIAVLAAQAMGKIHFISGLKSLLKTAEIWETRLPESEAFLIAVCQSLGALAQPEGVSFLENVSGETPQRRVKSYSLTARVEAVRALSKMNLPESWIFLDNLSDNLSEEKNPVLKTALQKIFDTPRSA
jgi:two-component system, cell cycle response regulator